MAKATTPVFNSGEVLTPSSLESAKNHPKTNAVAAKVVPK